ncbi:MAG: sigma-54-dependent transcriptional regulator [Candidatus Rokuibacteriota bacterium]
MRANTTPGPRILIVDDDPVTRRALGDTLTRAGFEVTPAATVAEALRLTADAEPALAILDLVLPDGDGIELLGSLRGTWPALPAIVVTAYVEPRSVVEAMRRGALDYLGKPIDPEVLLSAVRAALARRPAPVAASGKPVELPIVGVSAETAGLRETLVRLARTRPAGLLIAGPAGSGKTWLAQALHGASSRSQAPCIVYRCAEAYAPLTALFGTTGSSGTGLIAATHGGTLILDDVDRLDREGQMALLERADRQRAAGAPLLVGLTEAEHADGPLVAWLSRVRLNVPALADRTADVIPLARHFLAEAARRLGKTISGFTTDAEHRLLAHAWPGSVRELREAVERAAALGVGGAIRPEQLVLGSGGSPAVPAWAPAGPPRPLREIEDAYIDHVIALAGGNKTRAAQLLGIARETLRTRMLSRGGPAAASEEERSA